MASGEMSEAEFRSFLSDTLGAAQAPIWLSSAKMRSVSWVDSAISAQKNDAGNMAPAVI